MTDSHGDVTRLLQAIQAGDPDARDQLLPLVYDELRRLARQRLARERSADAPEATSLVHQAYLRLAGDGNDAWRSRAYFFGAAGEAMRRVLVERARERRTRKRGGDLVRVSLADSDAPGEPPDEEVLAVDQLLDRLEAKDPPMAQVAKLRYFAGLTVPETAEAMEISPRAVNRLWSAARAWLLRELERS